MIPHPEYESDFNEAVTGLREDLYKHQTSIYRKIESDVIAVWKQIQRIQGDIVLQISRIVPREL